MTAGLTRTCPPSPLDENPVRRHHRPLSVRRRHLVLADVSARPARARARGLLHRGHRRVRLRPGAEHARHRSDLRHDLHPQRARAVRPRRSLVVRELRRQLPRPQRRRGPALLRRRRSVHQPVRRLVVLARRVRAHPAQGVHRLGSGVHAARDRQGRAVVRRVLPALRSPVHLRREHRHRRRRRSRPARSPGTRPGSRSRSTTGAPTRAPARPLHDGDDLADRELHRRRRQQGSGVRQVHRSAVADAAAASSWRSTARSSCCASTAGTRWTRWACRARRADYRDFIQRSKAEFGVAKHTYVANRSGWFSDRTECYLASGRPALVQDTGWTRAPAVRRRPARVLDPRRSARRHRSHQQRLRPARARAPSRSRASTSTRARRPAAAAREACA